MKTSSLIPFLSIAVIALSCLTEKAQSATAFYGRLTLVSSVQLKGSRGENVPLLEPGSLIKVRYEREGHLWGFTSLVTGSRRVKLNIGESKVYFIFNSTQIHDDPTNFSFDSIGSATGQDVNLQGRSENRVISVGPPVRINASCTYSCVPNFTDFASGNLAAWRSQCNGSRDQLVRLTNFEAISILEFVDPVANNVVGTIESSHGIYSRDVVLQTYGACSR